ncbi:hypothetical protein [Candidatus Phytoplasma solani]|uniref:Uncharacterized protein n=1 Tax=Candidatus Phytoplasma solani TaxID=69896 RepID=A0A421NXL0_9MOLU|nr:hypothetical protein [Candidatus Phytoplasma solani]RMI88769.1 hypothetical protein PSSA1_v1c3670 [Candidatus Phytoplasma solani]
MQGNRLRVSQTFIVFNLLVLIFTFFLNNINLFAQRTIKSSDKKKITITNDQNPLNNGVWVKKNGEDFKETQEQLDALNLQDLKKLKDLTLIFPQNKRHIAKFRYYKQNQQLSKEDIIKALNQLIKDNNLSTTIEADDFLIENSAFKEVYYEDDEGEQWEGLFRVEDLMGNSLEFTFTKDILNLDDIIDNTDLGVISIKKDINLEERKNLVYQAIIAKNPNLKDKFLPKDFEFEPQNKTFNYIQNSISQIEHNEYDGELLLEINYQTIKQIKSETFKVYKNILIVISFFGVDFNHFSF